MVVALSLKSARKFYVSGNDKDLLFGPLKENISDGRTIDFLVSMKTISRKGLYHAMMPERKKLMKKLLIVKGFQVVGSIISSKPA